MHPSFRSFIFPLVPVLLRPLSLLEKLSTAVALLQSNVSQPKTNFNSTHELYCYMAGIQKAGKVSGHRFRIAKCFLGGNTCIPQTQFFTPTNLPLIPIHSLRVSSRVTELGTCLYTSLPRLTWSSLPVLTHPSAVPSIYTILLPHLPSAPLSQPSLYQLLCLSLPALLSGSRQPPHITSTTTLKHCFLTVHLRLPLGCRFSEARTCFGPPCTLTEPSTQHHHRSS